MREEDGSNDASRVARPASVVLKGVRDGVMPAVDDAQTAAPGLLGHPLNQTGTPPRRIQENLCNISPRPNDYLDVCCSARGLEHPRDRARNLGQNITGTIPTRDRKKELIQNQ